MRAKRPRDALDEAIRCEVRSTEHEDEFYRDERREGLLHALLKLHTVTPTTQTKMIDQDHTHAHVRRAQRRPRRPRRHGEARQATSSSSRLMVRIS